MKSLPCNGFPLHNRVCFTRVRIIYDTDKSHDSLGKSTLVIILL